MTRRRHLQAALLADPLKNWDVLRAVRAIEQRVRRDEAVLDVGTFASAVPPALSKLGYRVVVGLDLDPAVLRMSGGPGTSYVVGDLTQTDWPDAHFAAITAISVIEHGIAEDALLREITRLLCPGGIFVFSTDYWPEKQDTFGAELFGLPWIIYSADEIEAMVDRAAGFGLVPVGDPGESLRSADERPITFNGFEYTFLYGGFVKDGHAGASRRPAQSDTREGLLPQSSPR